MATKKYTMRCAVCYAEIKEGDVCYNHDYYAAWCQRCHEEWLGADSDNEEMYTAKEQPDFKWDDETRDMAARIITKLSNDRLEPLFGKDMLADFGYKGAQKRRFKCVVYKLHKLGVLQKDSCKDAQEKWWWTLNTSSIFSQFVATLK